MKKPEINLYIINSNFEKIAYRLCKKLVKKNYKVLINLKNENTTKNKPIKSGKTACVSKMGKWMIVVPPIRNTKISPSGKSCLAFEGTVDGLSTRTYLSGKTALISSG